MIIIFRVPIALLLVFFWTDLLAHPIIRLNYFEVLIRVCVLVLVRSRTVAGVFVALYRVQIFTTFAKVFRIHLDARGSYPYYRGLLPLSFCTISPLDIIFSHHKAFKYFSVHRALNALHQVL